jgi:hypothetical protein
MSDADKLHRSTKPVSVGMLTMAVDVLTACVKKLLTERDQRVKALEARVALLEQQSAGEAR